MLMIISPAKKLSNNSSKKIKPDSQIDFQKESEELVSIIKKYKPDKLAGLMNISPKLAELNYERYLKWKFPFNNEETGSAVLMFQGDVYKGLQAEDFSENEMDFTQQHLRILSGLYGVLKPSDQILPYRLEMGTKLKTKKGKDLYDFWADKIHQKIKEAIKDQGDNILVNLASNEYFKSVKAKKLGVNIITPTFKEYKEGLYKQVSFFAKKARGLMCRYIIQNKLTKPEDMMGFDFEKYSFNHELSSKTEFVFTR